jgi:hypothetical protein
MEGNICFDTKFLLMCTICIQSPVIADKIHEVTFKFEVSGVELLKRGRQLEK